MLTSSDQGLEMWNKTFSVIVFDPGFLTTTQSVQRARRLQEMNTGEWDGTDAVFVY